MRKSTLDVFEKLAKQEKISSIELMGRYGKITGNDIKEKNVINKINNPFVLFDFIGSDPEQKLILDFEYFIAIKFGLFSENSVLMERPVNTGRANFIAFLSIYYTLIKDQKVQIICSTEDEIKIIKEKLYEYSMWLNLAFVPKDYIEISTNQIGCENTVILSFSDDIGTRLAEFDRTNKYIFIINQDENEMMKEKIKETAISHGIHFTYCKQSISDLVINRKKYFYKMYDLLGRENLYKKVIK